MMDLKRFSSSSSSAIIFSYNDTKKEIITVLFTLRIYIILWQISRQIQIFTFGIPVSKIPQEAHFTE